MMDRSWFLLLVAGELDRAGQGALRVLDIVIELEVVAC